MKTLSTFLARAILKGYLWTRHSYNRMLSLIPSHIQSLVWFDEGEVRPIFVLTKPHLSWNSLWNQSKECANINLFPEHGFYIWSVWNSKTHSREHLCLRAERIKDIFPELASLKAIMRYHEQAIIDALLDFVYDEYRNNLQKNTIMDITWNKVHLLKALHKFHQSMYVSKNITGSALLKLYEFKSSKPLTEDERNMPIVVTDENFEQEILLQDEYLVV